MSAAPSGTSELATLGGGCFWCLEVVYRELRGVGDVVSGYAGGAGATPSYAQVGSGRTGHAEVVQVTFDPRVLSYQESLEDCFTIHDLTTPNRQGHDIDPQYRSLILYHSSEQRVVAEQTTAELAAAQPWDAPSVTQSEPLAACYPAEAYHQEYCRRNPEQAPCQPVVAPQVAEARQRFLAKLTQPASAR